MCQASDDLNNDHLVGNLDLGLKHSFKFHIFWKIYAEVAQYFIFCNSENMRVSFIPLAKHNRFYQVLVSDFNSEIIKLFLNSYMYMYIRKKS